MIVVSSTNERMCFDRARIESIQRQEFLAFGAEPGDSTSVGIGFGGPIEAFAFFGVGISGVHGP